MTNLDELQKLAEAATPGPWEWEEPSGDPWPSGDESLVTTWNEEDGEPRSVVTSWGYDADGVTASAEDRAFIAAAYPQVVLELIELVRRVEAERDAALAAIERVRLVIDNHRSVEQHNEMVPISDIADLIREPSSADYLAALDGAPETEEKP